LVDRCGRCGYREIGISPAGAGEFGAAMLRPMVSAAAGVATTKVPARTPTARVGPARAVVKRRANVRSMSVSLVLGPSAFGYAMNYCPVSVPCLSADGT
jgi:hypothetical protein